MCTCDFPTLKEKNLPAYQSNKHFDSLLLPSDDPSPVPAFTFHLSKSSMHCTHSHMQICHALEHIYCSVWTMKLTNPFTLLHMQSGMVGRSASDAGMSAQTGAEAQQSALPDLPEVGRPALERVYSSAKRQADSSWADSQSPHKRQEVDQSPEHAAAGPASQAEASDRDADDSMITEPEDETATGRLTVQLQGADSASADAQHALAPDDDATSNSSGGFMSYIPGTHANRASHAGQAPDPYLGDGPAARLASYIPGGTTAGRLASWLPGSSTAGRLADFAVSRAEQGFAHYSELPKAQEFSTSTETSTGLDSHVPGTTANWASQGDSGPELAASQSAQRHNTVGSQANQQDSDRGTATSGSSKQGIASGSGGSSSSGGGGGVMSYIPGTEANQASTAAQELGLDCDKSSGLASSLASYVPGMQANSASRAEEGPAATSGSSSGTASYVPGTGANRAADDKQSRVEADSPSHAQHGQLAESDGGSSVGSGIAGYIPGTQANRAAHADSESDSGTGSGLASYIPGTQANRETQAPSGESCDLLASTRVGVSDSVSLTNKVQSIRHFGSL